MSRSPHEGAFAPNQGVPLPIVMPMTREQTRHHYQRAVQKGGQAIVDTYNEDAKTIESDQELTTWINEYKKQCIGADVSEIEMVDTFGLPVVMLYRLLYKQAEADVMNENSGATDVYVLPLVKPGALAELSPDEAKTADFISSMLILMEEDGNHLLREWIEDFPGYMQRAKGVICGMYWLLKYHSKPREEKKD